MKIKTVAVDRDGKKVLINAIDFDPSKESLWSDEKPEGESKPTKDDLIAELEALGVEADKRMSVKNLQAKLDEALG
jgi:hypothetical protein